MYFLLLDDEQHEPRDRGMRGEKRRWRRRMRMPMMNQRCSSSSLQQRIESLQRHIGILRSARKDAVLSAREMRRANEKITEQLNSLTEKLCSSKQLTQVTLGKTGRWVKGGVSCKCEEVSYFSVFVFLFVVLLYLLGGWECSSSRSFALIMLNKCGWQAYPRLWRSAPWSRKKERNSLSVSLSLCLSLSLFPSFPLPLNVSTS